MTNGEDLSSRREQVWTTREARSSPEQHVARVYHSRICELVDGAYSGMDVSSPDCAYPPTKSRLVLNLTPFTLIFSDLGAGSRVHNDL